MERREEQQSREAATAFFHSFANAAVRFGRIRWVDFVAGRITFSFILPRSNVRPLSRVTYTQWMDGDQYPRVIQIEDFSDTEHRVFVITPTKARVYTVEDEHGDRSPDRNATSEEVEQLQQSHTNALLRLQQHQER